MVSSLAVADSQANGCAENASADTGQPVMFQHGSLTWGLSTRPVRYGEKLLVLLWLYNPTDTPLSVMTCAGIDYFWSHEIAVLDSAGNQVLSRAEERLLAEKKRNPASLFSDEFVCFRNFPITVPPHSCLQGSFSKPQYDFARDFNRYYSLPPGQYSLVPMKKSQEQNSRAGTGPGVKLPISILRP